MMSGWVAEPEGSTAETSKLQSIEMMKEFEESELLRPKMEEQKSRFVSCLHWAWHSPDSLPQLLSLTVAGTHSSSACCWSVGLFCADGFRCRLLLPTTAEHWWTAERSGRLCRPQPALQCPAICSTWFDWELSSSRGKPLPGSLSPSFNRLQNPISSAFQSEKKRSPRISIDDSTCTFREDLKIARIFV